MSNLHHLRQVGLQAHSASVLIADTLSKHTVSIRVNHHTLSYACTSACSTSPNTLGCPMGLRLLQGTLLAWPQLLRTKSKSSKHGCCRDPISLAEQLPLTDVEATRPIYVCRRNPVSLPSHPPSGLASASLAGAVAGRPWPRRVACSSILCTAQRGEVA